MFRPLTLAQLGLVLAVLLACAVDGANSPTTRISSTKPHQSAAEQDVENFDCETTDGWTVIGFDGKPVEGASLSSANKMLMFHYQRQVLAPLVHSALLTNLRELRLRLRSEVATTLVFAVQDRDGAAFNQPVEVPARKWTTVRLNPNGFKLNDDSPIKKKALEPRRLSLGYAFFDLGAALGASGENTITIDEVVVERAKTLKKSGPLVVTRAMEITDSVTYEGDIVVQKGGHLKISAPLFTLRGNVQVEDGGLEIADSAFLMPQRFNHELGLVFKGASRFIIKDSFFNTAFPVGLELQDTATLDIANTEFAGGFTCNTGEKVRIRAHQAKSLGEFIVNPGADIFFSDSNGIIIWLMLGANAKGRLSLPTGKQVNDWSAAHGLRARLKNCRDVLWCLISMKGSDVTVDRTEMYGAGLFFDGQSQIKFADVHNQRSLDDYLLGATDRKLRFVKSKVAAWNFYSHEQARVTVERSTFGEALTFGQSQMLISNSTCDGTGGYIGAHNSSQLKLVSSKIKSLVVARDESTIILDNCEVTGDVRATGKATVKLINTRVNGRVEKDPTATLTQQ